VNRQAQAVVMVLLGAVIVKASVTDAYLRYVKHGLRPLLIVGGLLLVAMGALALWYEIRDLARPVSRPHDGVDEHEHEHGHREPRVAWLLVLPVVALLLVAPPALGSYTAAQSGSMLTAQNASSDYGPLPPGDPVELGLLDYASRAVFDQGRSLTGRHLLLSGFITPGPQGQPMLARIVVACCAADGRPIKVGLSGNVPAGVSPNSWIQVIGTYSPTTTTDPVNGAVVPYLQVSTWKQIAVPEEPYEI
jgi:uncharacterized repeat protein (TIGR03943 family)